MHFSVMHRGFVMRFKCYAEVNLAESMDKLTVITGCDNALPFCVVMPLKLAHIGTGIAVLTETRADLSP